MESILQSSLLSGAVAEEQRRMQAQPRRKSADSDCPLPKPAEPAPVSAAELRLRDQALRDREQALKEREERLESKTSYQNSSLTPRPQLQIFIINMISFIAHYRHNFNLFMHFNVTFLIQNCALFSHNS